MKLIILEKLWKSLVKSDNEFINIHISLKLNTTRCNNCVLAFSLSFLWKFSEVAQTVIYEVCFSPDDGGSMFLRNVFIYTGSQPRRPTTTTSLWPWKLQMPREKTMFSDTVCTRLWTALAWTTGVQIERPIKMEIEKQANRQHTIQPPPFSYIYLQSPVSPKPFTILIHYQGKC
jgi:hypothetical protein